MNPTRDGTSLGRLPGTGTVPASAAHFDAIAQEYATWYEPESLRGYALQSRQQRALAMLDDAGGRILDIGCGPGALADELLRQGCEVWGVDAAPGMIAQCQRRCGESDRAHFAVGDATSLDLPSHFFDAVTCLGVIEKIRAYDAAVAEMVRVLKPGGTLVISFPNLLSPYAAWKLYGFYPAVALLQPVHRRLTRRPTPPTPRGVAARFQLWPSEVDHPRGAIAVLGRHGATVTDLVYFSPSLFLSPLDELFPGMAVKVTRRIERLGSRGLQWLGSGFIVKARTC